MRSLNAESVTGVVRQVNSSLSMNQQRLSEAEPGWSTFVISLIVCMAAFVAVHLVQYVLVSTPSYYRIGVPSWFWTRHGDYTRFRWSSLAIDLGLAAFCSYRAASWYWLYRWRRFNAASSE